MAFQQGLSGLNAASRNLDVIGHNIANSNTVGMKSSRAEFAEIYASSVNASGGMATGIGVAVAAVAQSFTQGNISVTGNDLDVAINGNGFFELTQPNGSAAYTRAGMFKLDREGNVVTNDGSNLMGYPTDADGNHVVRALFSVLPYTGAINHYLLSSTVYRWCEASERRSRSAGYEILDTNQELMFERESWLCLRHTNSGTNCFSKIFSCVNLRNKGEWMYLEYID